MIRGTLLILVCESDLAEVPGGRGSAARSRLVILTPYWDTIHEDTSHGKLRSVDDKQWVCITCTAVKVVPLGLMCQGSESNDLNVSTLCMSLRRLAHVYRENWVGSVFRKGRS